LPVDAIFVIKSETILHFVCKIGVRRGTRYNAHEKTGRADTTIRIAGTHFFPFYTTILFKENNTDLPVLSGYVRNRVSETVYGVRVCPVRNKWFVHLMALTPELQQQRGYFRLCKNAPVNRATTPCTKE